MITIKNKKQTNKQKNKQPIGFWYITVSHSLQSPNFNSNNNKIHITLQQASKRSVKETNRMLFNTDSLRVAFIYEEGDP